MSVIFWDFDGTLVHSNSLWSTTVFNSLKYVVPDTDIKFADIRKCMATGFTWHNPEKDYSDLVGDKWWQFMNNKICHDYMSLGVEEKDAVNAASLVRNNIKRAENYTLYSDAVTTLEKSIEKGNKNILLSNNYPDLIVVLSKLNIKTLFDSIVVSAEYGYDKPRRELFDIAKSLCPDEEYIMVGDNVKADIIGGNDAGIRTVLVHNGYNKNADFCCENLIDVFKFI